MNGQGDILEFLFMHDENQTSNAIDKLLSIVIQSKRYEINEIFSVYNASKNEYKQDQKWSIDAISFYGWQQTQQIFCFVNS